MSYNTNNGNLTVAFREGGSTGNFTSLGAGKFVLRLGDRSFEFDGESDATAGGFYRFANAGLSWSQGQSVSVKLFKQPVITIQPVKSPVTEGTDGSAGFRVVSDRTVTSALAVNVRQEFTGNYFTHGGLTQEFPVTIPANSSQATVSQTLVSDGVDEPDGSLKMTLRSGTGYTLGNPSSATVTIYDASARTLSIDNPSITEGHNGEKNLTFTARLGRPATADVIFSAYMLRDGTTVDNADVNIVNGIRYQNGAHVLFLGSTLLPGIRAGQTAKTITIRVRGDTTSERDETIVIELRNLSGPAQFAGGGTTLRATGTILDDDTEPPTLTLHAPDPVVEGDPGDARKEMKFTVRLSHAYTRDVTVQVFTDALSTTANKDGANNPATDAPPNSDTDVLHPHWATVLTIPAGATEATISAWVLGDDREEEDEILIVFLGFPTNTAHADDWISDEATGTIVDDDGPLPVLSVSRPSVREGGPGGNARLRFRVELSESFPVDVTVNYALDTGRSTATAGSDYLALAAGTLTFKPDETRRTIDVRVVGDAVEETREETVVLTFSNPVNAVFPEGGNIFRARGTIQDDDGANESLNTPPRITRLYFSEGGLSYTDRLTGTKPTVVSGTVFSAGYEAYDRDDPWHDRNKDGFHDRDGREVVEDAGIKNRYIVWTGGMRPLDPTGYARIDGRKWHGYGRYGPSSFMVAPLPTQAQVTAGTNYMEFTARVRDGEGERDSRVGKLYVEPRKPTVVVHGWNRQDRAGRFPNFRQWECRTAWMSVAGSHGGFWYEYSGRSWDFRVPLTEYTWEQMEGDTVTLLDGKGQPLGNRTSVNWVTFKAPPVDGSTEEEKVLKFKMTVKDANGLTAEKEFYYTISHLDRDPTAEPVAEAGLDINTFAGTTALLRARGRSVACQGTISAPGTSPGEAGGRVTFHWEQVSGPAVPLPDPSRQELRVPVPPDASPGTVYTFQVTVTDEAGRTDTDFASVTVESGTPPTANAGPDLEALPGTTVTLQGRDSTNPHGAWHEMAHSWVQQEGPAVELSDPTKGTPSFEVPADTPVGTSFRFALTVTDEEGDADTDEMTVRVVAALSATPPTANAGPDLEAEPGETVTLQGKGSINPHGKWWRMAFLWTQTAGPEVELSDPTKGLPSFTVPSDAAPGTVFAFSLTVTDKDGETDTDAMTVTVPGGAPPAAADAGPDLTVAPGATAELGTEGEAVEGWTWAWTQTSGPSVTLTGADAPQASFVVPDDAADGAVYAFSLTVTDASGSTATDEATATVSATPVMTVSSPSVAEGGPGARTALTFTLRLDRASVRSLAPGVRVTASGSAAYLRVDDPATATGGDGTDVVGRARADRRAAGAVTFAPGTTEATLTFTVLGDAGLEADEILEVEFAPVDGLALPGGAQSLLARGTIVNDDTAPPVTADAGPDLEVAPGETATLGTTPEIVEGADWTYAWTQTSGSSVTLAGADAPRASFEMPPDAPDGAVYAFSLTVTDAHGNTASDEVTVSAPANAAPSFAEGAETERSVAENAAADAAVGEPVAAADDDGDALTYRLGGADAASFGIDAATGQLKTAASYDFETKASYAVTVQADDGRGGTALIAVSVSVSDLDEAPSAPPAPTVTAVPGAPDSLLVVVTAPENTGPPVIGYNLRYRMAGESAFTGTAHTGIEDDRATLTSLSPGTVYEVQAEAVSEEGTSPWSPTGSGRTASACATNLGSLGVGGSAERGGEYWDNPDCRAHHRTDRPARYFRFTLSERATVSIGLTTGADAALFVSKGTPKNGWGTPAKAGMAHRLQVRRDNGKLVHEESLSTSKVLAPGEYTAEAVLDADGTEAWRVPSFGLSVAATAPPAAVSVADARVVEGPGAKLSFAVTLDYAAPGTARVSWATSDGTAVAGQDYTAGSGTLTFAPGETSKTITVAVLDDAHDEGEETLTLTLSNADGMLLGDAEATGTIANQDPVLNAWLSRFGRTVASQTVEAVTERFAAPAGTGSHMTLGGQRIGLSSSGGTGTDVPGTGPGQPGPLLTALAAAGQPDAGWPSGTGSVPAAGVIPGSPGTAEPRSMTARDLLLGSSFRLSAGGGNSGSAPRWTAWGRAALERFENSGGELPLDGEVVTGVFGADRESRDWLAGVALTHSVGEGGMRPRGMAMEYDVDSELTAVHPYLHLRLSDRLSAWVLAGYGQGDLTLTQKREAGGADGEGAGTGRTTWKTDTAMTLGAAGARGDVLVPAEAGGFGLALRGDAFWVRTTSDAISGVESLGNLAGADADASRVRLVLEGSRVLTLGSGATLTPSLEVGVRHDGGDAESGAGMELGGSMRYADPSSGLAADVSARTLLAHGDGDYREWGVSGALRWTPGARGRGLSLTLTPAYGADAGGTDRLWSVRDARALAPANGNTDPAARLEAEAGYGLAAFGDGFTGTPYAGFGYSDAERRYRLGWRLTRADDPGPFAFSLEASRRESANDHEPEHGIGFRLTRRW